MLTMMMMIKMMMMVVVVVVVMMTLIKLADAYNITAGRARLRAEWFNPKYERQSLEPEERYFFEQVR